MSEDTVSPVDQATQTLLAVAEANPLHRCSRQFTRKVNEIKTLAERIEADAIERAEYDATAKANAEAKADAEAKATLKAATVAAKKAADASEALNETLIEALAKSQRSK